MSERLFTEFNFSNLGDPYFKEDSVREELINPFLHELGYSTNGLNQIIRSKSLSHPFIKIGSSKREIRIVPDYLLTSEGKVAWVLDAKNPSEEIVCGENVEQVYSYAIHPEIRAEIFALCNGREFVAWKVDVEDPILYFQLSEIKQHWNTVYQTLAPYCFSIEGRSDLRELRDRGIFSYSAITPLPEIKDLRKQSAKRHFGVHPYFTRQVWNVVQEYIKNFTQPGDIVLDPFAGSGITSIEALILGRKSIHIDINPLSTFIVKNLISKVNLDDLSLEFRRIHREFVANKPESPAEIEQAINTYDYPKNIPLPRGSDVQYVHELFAPSQLAQLAFLKHLIMQTKDEVIRGSLLLMFSGLLNKINLTYHASKGRSEGRGNSGMFAYYRYRIAPKPALLNVEKYFELRYRRVIAAKKELGPLFSEEALQNIEVYKGSATDLNQIEDESIDYIYTDPPYGSKIPYLDLSVMWNSWLDLDVTEDDYQLEAIEGGTLDKDKDEYSTLLAKSISEMYRVLKFERWMSFVFAHKNPAYWHLIVDAAENAGFEYIGSVKQLNNKISFKKRQNPFTVLSGQLIINFRKSTNPKSIMRINLGADVFEIILETIEAVIAKNDGATLEEINDELITKGIELGFLDILSAEYSDLSPLLNEHFDYDKDEQKFHIRPESKFKTRIDVRLRIRYFLISYLRRMKSSNYHPSFDEIVLNIMPLLKNGVTPEEQTILSVLELIAARTEDGKWMLIEDSAQLNLL